jgi:hypothetical protein
VKKKEGSRTPYSILCQQPTPTILKHHGVEVWILSATQASEQGEGVRQAVMLNLHCPYTGPNRGISGFRPAPNSSVPVLLFCLQFSLLICLLHTCLRLQHLSDCVYLLSHRIYVPCEAAAWIIIYYAYFMRLRKHIERSKTQTTVCD